MQLVDLIARDLRAGRSATAAGLAHRLLTYLGMDMHEDAPYSVLLVEDDFALRDFLSGELARREMIVVTAEDHVEAMNYLDTVFARPLECDLPDVVVTDLVNEKGSGFELLAYTVGSWKIPTILITAFGTPTAHARAASMGAVACMDKPFDIDELCTMIERAAVATRYLRELLARRIIGDSHFSAPVSAGETARPSGRSYSPLRSFGYQPPADPDDR